MTYSRVLSSSTASRLPGSLSKLRLGLRYQSAALPNSVQQWEKLADKELSRAKNVSVETLRTERITPEGVSIQPVYWDLNSDDPEMPGVFPFTRGPYATMVRFRRGVSSFNTSWISSHHFSICSIRIVHGLSDSTPVFPLLRNPMHFTRETLRQVNKGSALPLICLPTEDTTATMNVSLVMWEWQALLSIR
jgi:hypothetical protein